MIRDRLQLLLVGDCVVDGRQMVQAQATVDSFGLGPFITSANERDLLSVTREMRHAKIPVGAALPVPKRD